jgi:hypothetical protein
MKKYAFLFGILFIPAIANAASLRLCYDTASLNADTAKIQLLANGNLAIGDVLAGTTVSGTKRCGDYPFPSTLTKGTDYTLTLKSVNAIGEVSGASNALPFRFPNPPANPTGFTVQIIVP